MYLYREIYRTQITIDEHAAEVKRLSGTETYRATVCDHDAGERALLERAGVPTVKAIKKIEGGINAVRARLVKQTDGRPRIYFLRTASTTIDRALADGLKPVSTVGEFDCYAFPSTASTRLKEEPIKEHDHGMDAMRYAVMHLDSQPAAVPYVSRLR
jgi:phage terminase large subunit